MAQERSASTAPTTRSARCGEDASVVPLAGRRRRVQGARGPVDLEAADAALADASPEAVVAWAAETFGDGLAVSTSFGIHSAATLHLVTRVAPGIPVIWVDTGYLPVETYRFAEALTRRLDLDLRVYQSPMSPAHMEALEGRPWEAGTLEASERYDRLRKVEPMQRALRELGVTGWIAGLRADQTEFRRGLRRIDRQGPRAKIHPILHWTSRDAHAYLKRHDLPDHPLFEQGYATVGDWHSSRPVAAGDAHERDTRFGGLKQECGIHLTPDEDDSLRSSGL
jgi:phosphoadenosine phosphosulfate reductase